MDAQDLDNWRNESTRALSKLERKQATDKTSFLASLASTSVDNEVAIDTTAPTVTIEQAAAQTDPTSALPIEFDVTFSEPVTGFDETDVVLGGTAVLVPAAF